jgi:hypothetical protein
MKPIHEVHREDLTDLNDDDDFSSSMKDIGVFPDNPEAKSEILRVLRRAGITHVDNETVALLPSWNDVEDLYGNVAEDQPLLVAGYDTCAKFRSRIKLEDAMVGTAGLFNSGTNAMTYYLRANLRIGPENAAKRHHGVLSQVPWDKHFLPSLRNDHTAQHMESVVKEHVLPIVVIRDPFTWVHSMCSTPYLIQLETPNDSNTNIPQKQQHFALPSLMNESPSYVAIPAMTNRTWPSLFHLWNDWYNEYLRSTSNEPFLMVRFEDMLFRPRSVVDRIRECVGASWVEENTFTYVVDHSKWEHIRFHGPQSNMISAIIKHSNPRRRRKGLSERDLRMAKEILDPDLMRRFGYKFPDGLYNRYHYSAAARADSV